MVEEAHDQATSCYGKRAHDVSRNRRPAVGISRRWLGRSDKFALTRICAKRARYQQEYQQTALIYNKGERPIVRMQTILSVSVFGSLSSLYCVRSGGPKAQAPLRRRSRGSPFRYLIVFVGQYVAALGRTFFGADLQPSLPLACVLPGARVFCRCTKTLALTAIDSRTGDLNRSAAVVSVCNNSTGDEQERNSGCNRARSRGHLSDVPPIMNGSALLRRRALAASDGSL